MDKWSGSWVTVLALLGTLVNIALPIFLSRVEKKTTISISKQIPLGYEAANATTALLLHVARGRRRLLFIGVPVQLIAVVLSGFRWQASTSIIAAACVELIAIGFIAVAYSKWSRTFHPQSVENIFRSVHQRMSALTAHKQNN